MVRGIGYRAAATVFVFAGLWFILGLLMLASPIPHALGIGSAMFVAWFLIFLAIVALAGGSLTMAAINGIFPRAERLAPRSPAARAAGTAALAGSARTTAALRDDAPSGPTATHDADGRPLPWTSSPLPDRAPRRSPSRPRPTDPGARR